MFSFLNNNNTISSYNPTPISATNTGYQTNNRFPVFPPLMQDGRSIVSSWQPEAVINDRILKNHGIQSNWQYRNFLTKHSREILEHNFREECNDTGYNTISFTPYDYHTRTPYRYKSIEDRTLPLGVQDSDLKEVYLTREQLEARKIAPEITQAELVNKLGVGR
jgi:hypothetical protein